MQQLAARQAALPVRSTEIAWGCHRSESQRLLRPLMVSRCLTAAQVTGRRLLQQQLAELPGARRSRRHHQHSSAAMGTSIRPPFLGAIYASSAANSTAFAATAAGAVHRRAEYYSRSRHLQQQSSLSGTLQDTICLVPTANWPVDGPQDITFSCPDMQQRPKLAGFQPAEMPVVFHCELRGSCKQ